MPYEHKDDLPEDVRGALPNIRFDRKIDNRIFETEL